MLRMSRLTDYGTVVLAYMASPHDGVEGGLHTAAEVAAETRLGPATVSKLLKTLTRAGLVNSVRGSSGGYALARPSREISAAQIIDALEGPVSITECAGQPSRCDLESVCGVGNAWQQINVSIRRALEDISLAQLADPERRRNVRIDLSRSLDDGAGRLA